MSEWFADDSFWAALYPFEFADDVLAAGDAQVTRAIHLSGVARGDVLDLGCGPGRHAIALARRGFRVTAVDISPFHLARARERAAAARISVEFVEADMRAFVRPDAFDLVLSLFTSFGYFDDERDDLGVLANIHRGLRPGGAVVMDVMGKERTARMLQPTVMERGHDGALLVRRHQVVDDWTRVKNEWTIVRDGQERTYEFTVRIYSGRELRDLFGAAGFHRIMLFGGLDGRPYDFDAERLIVVAGK